MKEAYWGYGMIIIFIFALFIFWFTSRTTVYNQQDYLYMKGQVEAAMMDAIDWQAYKQGFYVCTNKRADNNGVYNMTDVNDYEVITCANKPSICDSNGNLLLVSKGEIKSENISKLENCEAIVAEYKIIAGKSDNKGNILLDNCPNGDNVTTKDGFGCLLKARLDSILLDGYNSKKFKYKLEINKVIEYPPKVSVKLSYNQEIRNSLNNETDSYDVVNNIDAILEDDGMVYFYDEPKFYVTFNTDGGNEIERQVIEPGSLVSKPSNPKKKNSIFVEWQLNGKKFDFDNTIITGNVELKAVWSTTKLNDTFTVTLVTNTYHNAEVKASVKTASGITPTIEYYSDASCKTLTTTNNASSRGGAPIKVGTYYIIAKTKGNSNYNASGIKCTKAVVIDSTMCGDLNYDGVVNGKDSIILSRYLNKQYNLTYTDNADLNLDGSIDQIDSKIMDGILAGNLTCPATNYRLYGDVVQDGVVNFLDVAAVDNYLKGQIALSDTSLKNGDVDLDGVVSYRDRLLINQKLDDTSLSLGSKSLQVEHMIPGDYNFDNVFDYDDYDLFEEFLNNPHRVTAPYMKGHFDLNNDSKIDDKDLEILIKWIDADLSLLDINSLVLEKTDDGLNLSDDYIAITDKVSVNSVKFDVYYVLNIKNDFEEISKLKTFAKGSLAQAAKINQKILKLVQKDGTKFVFIASYDCDSYSLSQGSYQFSGNARIKNRHLVVAYDRNLTDPKYNQQAVIHELGHVYDHTLYYELTGISGEAGVTAFSEADIKSGTYIVNSNVRKINVNKLQSLYYNNKSWKTLAKEEAAILTDNKIRDKYFKDTFGVFSSTDASGYIGAPWEFFAACFHQYYVSDNNRKDLKKLAPNCYAGVERMISFVN